MKNKLLIIFIAILIFLPVNVLASASSEIMYRMDLYINGNIQKNAAIVNNNGKVMVPALEFSRKLGINAEFNTKSLIYTISNQNNEISYNIDDNTASINGKYVFCPEGAQIIEGSIYIPATFTCSALGLKTYIYYAKNRYMVFTPYDGKIIYTVEWGDALWKISNMFYTSIANIKNYNGLTSDYIYAGQKLVTGYFTPQDNSYNAYTSSGATVKSGPGFSYQDAGYLKAWTQITVLGKNNDWYYVKTSKGTGYIYKSVIYIKQDRTFSDSSSYFNRVMPYDKSGDYITYYDYTVKSGDTIWSIACDFGIPNYELASVNNIDSSSYLSIGDVLSIPIHHISIKEKSNDGAGEILDWFTQGQYVFPIETKGVLIEPETGLSISIKRTIGANHSDVETLTYNDTLVLKKIFGGNWSWERKPFILAVGQRRFAVSVSAMPHAGIDGVPFLEYVDNRSGDYGYGPNYDSIAGNGMDGHFDLFFLNSTRHKDGEIDPAHQISVMLSGGLR